MSMLTLIGVVALLTFVPCTALLTFLHARAARNTVYNGVTHERT